MLNVALVCEVSMNTPFAMSPPTKFCENPMCLEPVHEFPYTTPDGRVYCSPVCRFDHEETENSREVLEVLQ